MRNTIQEAAHEAAVFILENARDFGDAQFKGRVDMVTKIDLGAEKIILDKIRSAFPDHSIITEESDDKETTSDYRWIIDPLDGTTNFVHAFPFVSVSIALEYQREVVMGIVNNPFMKEYFFAETGNGAFLNDQPIHVSENETLNRSLLATGFPYVVSEKFERNMALFSKIYRQTQGVRRAGSAAVDLCYVACGRLDGFWEFELNPWDVAAGSLIVKEAGGKLSDFSGNRLNIFKREILATNGLIHAELLKNF
ncbi:MAG: inositol monophosphatase [Candidatus Marinimicrobia bacterium]|nr:inositol monophosphatase [Candidatus Neomarinimicrobiota bacterium]